MAIPLRTQDATLFVERIPGLAHALGDGGIAVRIKDDREPARVNALRHVDPERPSLSRVLLPSYSATSWNYKWLNAPTQVLHLSLNL